MRTFAVLATILRASLRGLRASKLTAGIGILTIAVVLVLVGGFALLVDNMSEVLHRFGEELQVTAYLEEGLSESEQNDLAQSVRTVEGVATVKLISKAEALERFRESTGGGTLLEGLDQNPLPASLEISLFSQSRTPAGLEIVLGSISGVPGIAELAHGQEWVEGYARFTSLVRAAGIVLGVVLSLAALMIVANTIRLGVYAREDEIEILALVGASRSFVRTPFLIEGTMQGALGGALALLLLFATFQGVLPQLEYGLEMVLGSTRPHFFSLSQAGGLLGGGAVLGLIGSTMALLGGRSTA